MCIIVVVVSIAMANFSVPQAHGNGKAFHGSLSEERQSLSLVWCCLCVQKRPNHSFFLRDDCNWRLLSYRDLLQRADS